MPLITGNAWNFIPLGFNLNFEFRFLRHKFQEYFGLDFRADDFLERPKHDLKLIGVILNGGEFTGAILDSFTDKKHGGWMVPEWYRDKKWDEITDYVKGEAKATVDFWQKQRKLAPSISKVALSS